METKFFTTDGSLALAKDYSDRNPGSVVIHLNELTADERKLYKISDHDTKLIDGVNVRVFHLVVPASKDHPILESA